LLKAFFDNPAINAVRDFLQAVGQALDQIGFVVFRGFGLEKLFPHCRQLRHGHLRQGGDPC
jgi:hypothetical protein